ncbi:MAG: iron chelate uptake ABC transporter family permease subunit [Actinomycetota bacterium]
MSKGPFTRKAAIVCDDWGTAVGADMGLLARLDREISWAEGELAEILPQTPAHILTTLPRVAVVRASIYGGALEDVTRFKNAGQVYRLSGLVPRLYESAGKERAGAHISREGKVELREAIIARGKALRQGHPDFARYAAGVLLLSGLLGALLVMVTDVVAQHAFAPVTLPAGVVTAALGAPYFMFLLYRTHRRA